MAKLAKLVFIRLSFEPGHNHIHTYPIVTRKYPKSNNCTTAPFIGQLPIFKLAMILFKGMTPGIFNLLPPSKIQDLQVPGGTSYILVPIAWTLFFLKAPEALHRLSVRPS